MSPQQGHADAHQTCLAHLARDVAYAIEGGEDILPMRLKLFKKARRCMFLFSSNSIT